jgi:hypothetical protein
MQRVCVLSFLTLLSILTSGTTSALADPFGGGFVEFLMRGARQSTPQSNTAAYGHYPADLGPGMVEAPDQPGRLVMDPRFLRQAVNYDGHEEKVQSSSTRVNACSIWCKARVGRSATASA